MFAMPSLFAGNKVNPAIFQAALSRFFRPDRQRGKARQPPQRRKILFESLEPRLLMSGDFNPVAPMGSLIHQFSQSGALETADSTVSYNLSLDAGQKISVVFDTEDADLRGTIELYDTDGATLLGSAWAANPGEMALLDSVVAGNAGTYRLDVRNLAGEGAFSTEIFLNATVETEVLGMVGNDDLASAQDLAPSWLDLPNGGQRAAAVGIVESGSADFYKLDLSVGDIAGFALSSMQPGAGAGLRLALLDDGGNLLALGDASAGNVDQMIDGFAAGTGTYYLRVVGNGGESYSLLAMRQARFEYEPNGTAAQARPLSPMREVLGSLNRVTSSFSPETGTVGSTGFYLYLYDASGFRWDIVGNGRISDGSDDAYDGGMQHTGFPTLSTGQLEFGGREVVIGPATIGDVQVTRKIYVPSDQSYARFLEIVSNPGASTVNYTLPIYTNLGSDGSERYVMTSSGDNTATTADDWLITDDSISGSSGGDPVVTHVVSGQGGAQRAASFSRGSGVVNYSYDLTLAPGETKIVMHFASQASSQSTAVTRAGQLANLELGALDGMSMAELAQVVNFKLVDSADNYLIEVLPGDNLVLATTTPYGVGDLGPSPLDPLNTLDPLVELYDPNGTLVASNNNGAGDGRNAYLAYTVPVDAGGTYRVRVAPVSGGGEYTLAVQGATGSLAGGMRVTDSSVPDGAQVTAFPTNLDITFSSAVRLDSVQTTDLVVTDAVGNPIAVTGATLADAHGVRFQLGAPVDVDGHYNVSLASGAVFDLTGGAANEAYSSGFDVDASPPQVVSPSVVDGARFAPGAFAFSADFSEALASDGLDADDVVLLENFSNTAITPLTFDYNPATHHLDTTFDALVEGSYTLSLKSRADAFRDLYGNPLDGNGDGIAGDDFTVDFFVDSDVQPFPTPLHARYPAGSLSYGGDLEGVLYDAAGADSDTYTIELDANQILTVALFPLDAGLMARVEVIGPDGVTVIGAHDAAAPGAVAALNHLHAQDAGIYRLVLSSLDDAGGPTAGRYELSVLLNSAGEAEEAGFGGNDDQGDAQYLTQATLDLGNGIGQASVAGTLEAKHFTGAQPMLLGTLGRGGTPSTLVELDPGNGAVLRTIGPVGYAINGLEYAAGSGILYGTVSDNDANAPGYLVSIDLVTGAGTPIGSGADVGTLLNVTSDSVGNLYAWTESGDDLVTLDPYTGLGQVVGNAGLSTWTHSLAFDADDDLYFVNGDGNFYLLDTTTGVPTYQFSLPEQTAHHGDFDPLTGHFYAVGNTSATTPLVVIDVAQQSLVASFETGVQLHTLTFTPGGGSLTEPQDWYRFDLVADVSATLSLSLDNPYFNDAIVLELYDAGGNLVTLSQPGGDDVAQSIRAFVPAADGTYYARISGDAPGGYTLVLTTGADFGLERGDQDISPSRQVVGAIAYAEDVDTYLLHVSNGDAVTLWTGTSGDGGGEPANLLEAALSVYDPDDNLVAGGDHNAVIGFTAATDGAYRVELSALNGSSGDYVLNSNGATGLAPAFTVSAVDPADSSVLSGYPGSITLDFSTPIDLRMLDPGNILITSADGGTHNGDGAITIVDADTVIYGIASAEAGEGNYTLTLADGALRDLSGRPLAAFTSSFRWDATPPTVVSSSVSEDDVVAAGGLHVVIGFSEAMLADVLDAADVWLVNDTTGTPFTAGSLAYDGTNQILGIDFAGLSEGSYTLMLRSQADAFRDIAGLLLDGEYAAALPSGDGAEGGDFVVHFTVDIDAPVPYAVPLDAIQPDGSLIHDPAMTGLFHMEGDSDDYTLDLDAGQTLSVKLTPLDSVVRGHIALLDAGGNLLDDATGTTAGQAVILQTVPIANAGTYTIRVTAERGPGTYQVQALLNAALEVEDNSNFSETRDDAQNIDNSFIAVGANGSRGAVRGALGGTTNLAVAVDGETNVFSAGAAGSFDGLLPNSIEFAAGPGNVFTFPDVSGLVSFDGATLTVPPDGGDGGSGTTDILSSPTNYPGISGIVYGHGDPDFPDYTTWPGLGYYPGKTMFLTGVFLSDAAPVDPAPDRLDFTNGDGGMGTEFLTLSPELGQTFFIGDGRTALNDLQQFIAPTGATHLFLGFADASQFGHPSSEAGSYGDNYGALTAQVQLNGGSVTDADWYSFSLDAHEFSTITLSRDDMSQPGNIELELHDANGNLLATGNAGSGILDRYISGFAPAAAGTFYLRVSGDVADYSLLVTRNLDFDLAIPGQVQDISQTFSVLGGSLGGAGVEGYAYLRSNTGGTWGNSTPQAAMDAAFGGGNWDNLYFETSDLASVLANHSTLYLEGSDSIATELETFLDLHLSELEAWVAQGNTLFINAAPNENNGMNLGFGGVTLRYSDSSGSGTIVDSGHPIFQGPATPVVATYTGSSFTHASVSGGGITPLINDNTGDAVLAELSWGAGTVLFGGMTTTNFHSPQPEATNLRGNILAYAASRVLVSDRYSFAANLGDNLVIETGTPGDGAGEPGNVLDIALKLYGPDDVEVPSTDYSETSPDGRNVRIEYLATQSGGYRVEVRAENQTMGSYVLQVSGSSVAPAPFAVSGSNPADGALLVGFPATYTVDLSEAVLLSSIDAADLTVNGVAAGSVSIVDADTLQFSIANADVGDGVYDVEIAAGALTSLSGKPLEIFSASFDADATAPTVIASSLAGGEILAPGDLVYIATFSEPLATTGLGFDDVTLTNTDTGAVIPLAVPGLKGEYFNVGHALSTLADVDFNAPPSATRTDAQVSFGDSNGMDGLGLYDYYAARWTGSVLAETAGSYTFHTSSDDGSRLYIDGNLVVDNDGLHGTQERSGTVALSAGYHDLRLEFFENSGGATISLSWTPPGGAKALIPESVLYNQYSAGLGLFDYDPASRTLTVNYRDLPEGNYSLRLASGAEAFRDLRGNLLDGEYAGVLPSGDGGAGGDFSLNFSMDTVGATPLAALEGVAPGGSLIYDPPASGNLYATGDVDDHTLTIEGGQKASVRVTPDAATLSIQVELIGPDGTTVLGSASAAGGETVLLQNVSLAESGLYTVRIGSLGGSGNYETQLLLNAQLV
ncbi:MAG: Ig-like domain-containing protein [Pseudomonadota bacterium]|nr:Ig-like domain-containing protein [Pseudomonadota bacterium]